MPACCFLQHCLESNSKVTGQGLELNITVGFSLTLTDITRKMIRYGAKKKHPAAGFLLLEELAGMNIVLPFMSKNLRRISAAPFRSQSDHERRVGGVIGGGHLFRQQQ